MLETENGAASSTPIVPDELGDDLEANVGWLAARPELGTRATLFELGNGPPAQLHAFDSLEDVTYDNVRELFGGGRYQIRFRQRGGKMLRAIQIRVIGPKLPREGEAPAAPAAPVHDARLERLERLVEKLAERVTETKTGNAPDIVALATAISTMQAPILAALAETRSPKGMDATGMLDLITRVVELTRDSGGGSGYGDVVSGLGRPLLELLNRFSGPGAASPLPAAEQLPPITAAGPVPASSSAPPPGWFAVLQPALGHLLQLAALHADVEWWASEIIEKAEDSQLVWIRAELERREAFEAEFYQWVPQAAQHREWFGRFWTAIAEELAALAEEDPPD